MESFWKWLTVANARGVFFGALAGLAVVLGWWVWIQIQAARNPPHSSANKSQAETQTRSMLTYFLTSEVYRLNQESAGNPFMGQPKRDTPPVQKNTEPAAVLKTPVVVTPPPPPPPPPKPEPKKIKLVYRGRIVQSNGQVVALFELYDNPIPRTVAYKPGQALFGSRISAIREKYIELVTASNATNLLALGQTEQITEEK